jgi:hypothetical protein
VRRDLTALERAVATVTAVPSRSERSVTNPVNARTAKATHARQKERGIARREEKLPRWRSIILDAGTDSATRATAADRS